MVDRRRSSYFSSFDAMIPFLYVIQWLIERNVGTEPLCDFMKSFLDFILINYVLLAVVGYQSLFKCVVIMGVIHRWRGL